jgi:hypothetical protein
MLSESVCIKRLTVIKTIQKKDTLLNVESVSIMGKAGILEGEKRRHHDLTPISMKELQMLNKMN